MTDEADLVSIIIPTYNRAALLPRAVESALRQTFPRIEAVIVDDGSVDGTDRLVAEAWGNDPRVVYVRQRNRGAAAARNRGFQESRGGFIALLDSDDEWKPWKIEMQLACLARLPSVGMIWTDMEAIGPGGRIVDARYLRTMYGAWRRFDPDVILPQRHDLGALAPTVPEVAGAVARVGSIFSPMVTGNLVHTSTVLLRRERLEAVGGFDESLAVSGEDFDFHLRVCREGPVALAEVSSIRYQIGMPDRLTRHKAAVARNYLRTVERALARDGDRIDLPQGMIRDVLAGANAWTAATMHETGDRRGARRHFARSLMLRPGQPRVWAELALSCAPATLDFALRKARARALGKPFR